jgi:LysM repeat protein
VKPSRIAISEKLVIPQVNLKAVNSSPEPKATATITANLTNSSTQSISTSGSTYKISKGDTFYSVARKHKISLASLSAANPGVNPDKIQIGQIISLTESATQSTKPTPSKTTPTKKPASAYKPLPEVVKVVKEATPAKPTPKSKPTESYVQQSGDVARTVPVSREMTFGAFAKHHGTSITALNTLNGLDLAADEPMAAGSELFIPNE